ncbi:hypothetical protein F2Q70_00017541 [Brassica cretica]|uniref:Uncharacterized protein n=1 Tax=Brassica cretica TaxID=69181 RepID=A0A8S9HR11_BRACR|nr:hypothetical protein F2Q70_00017541 [Brassica cretica]
MGYQTNFLQKLCGITGTVILKSLYIDGSFNVIYTYNFPHYVSKVAAVSAWEDIIRQNDSNESSRHAIEETKSRAHLKGIVAIGCRTREGTSTLIVQTGEAVKRQEALTRGVGDDVMKHHVNAIIDDDLCQVVKQKKLQEGDFEVESSLSFDGSHWCRSTLDFEH